MKATPRSDSCSLAGPMHAAQRPGRGRPRPRFLAACGRSEFGSSGLPAWRGGGATVVIARDYGLARLYYRWITLVLPLFYRCFVGDLSVPPSRLAGPLGRAAAVCRGGTTALVCTDSPSQPSTCCLV